MNKIINFIGPKVITSNVIDKKLNLKLDWGINGNVNISKVVISKTKNGFLYEDYYGTNEPKLTRNFFDIDFMFWEYELPKCLKQIVKKLPVTESKEDFISSNFYNSLYDELKNIY